MLKIGDKFPEDGKSNIYDFNSPEEVVLPGDRVRYAGSLPIEIVRMATYSEREGFGDTIISWGRMYKWVWLRSAITVQFEHAKALDGLRRLRSFNNPNNARFNVRISEADIKRANADRETFPGTDKELMDEYEAWLETLRNPPFSYLAPCSETAISKLRETLSGRTVWKYHETSIVPAAKE